MKVFTKDRGARGASIRTRWAALGAAVAVSIGAGGIWHAEATSGDGVDGAVLTAITPQRLLDTRGASPVGALDGSGAPLRLQVTGDAVPSGASAVVMNVTAVQARASAVGGFVTVYPCDVPRPNTSNLNFVDGQTVPNQVTVALAADGTVCFHVYGRAHLLADVTGYVDDDRLRAIESELSALRTLERDITEAETDLSAYYTADETDAAIAGAVADLALADIDVDGLVDADELADAIAAVNASLGSAIATEVNGAVGTAVETAVDEAVTPAVASAVDEAVGTAVEGAVDAALSGHAPSPLGVPAYGRAIATLGVADQPSFWPHSGLDLRITEGVDGHAWVVHRDTNESVWLTACDDVICRSATSNRLAASGGAHGLDIVLGPDGMPRIAVDDAAASPTLMVVTCTSPTCASVTSAAVPTTGDGGRDAALAVDTHGAVLVAHRGSEGLLLTRCVDTTCDAPTTITLAGDHRTPDITIGADGRPIIVTAGDAGVTAVRCADSTCTAFDTAHTIAAAGASPQVTIGIDGRPLVAYVHDATVGVSHCADSACTTVAAHTVVDADPAGVGDDLSLALAADGHPVLTHVIAAGTADARLRITECDDTTCATATSTTTNVPALAAASVVARDAALLSAVRVVDGDGSGVHLHRQIYTALTPSGW
ncbi:MAG: hypothetical protein O3A28_01085 [Actinomycetota bacterium]|nr:hypothetical protein [Actinomycetota bacterium]